ncbi:MAG TPA: PH domain-containing protein, partial [Acidimicrobiales bacterium]|nr:PH domain-containing protein [Acidimicrobiales bacterium]
WVVYFYRLTSMVVVIRGDTLTVRNLLRTRHLPRSVVSEVSLGESSIAKSPNQTVIVTTSEGVHVPLDACARSLQSRRKRRRVEEFHRRVSDWCSPAAGQEIEPGQSDELELVSAE